MDTCIWTVTYIWTDTYIWMVISLSWSLSSAVWEICRYYFQDWLAAKYFCHASFFTAMEWFIFFVTRGNQYCNTNIHVYLNFVQPAILNYDTPFSCEYIPHRFQFRGKVTQWIEFSFVLFFLLNTLILLIFELFISQVN